ncbi:DUF2779 domain-containing protein [Alkalilimnicola ehrlichii]|uniref:DUF2779 domain-containing protein n=1 Tax=Alkalilimnicola ehrlichii TaxID=351052 RepID=UPI0015F2994F|nr:DUF2779 domain-containing protein [Alkalilimnicola ehrlichii]
MPYRTRPGAAPEPVDFLDLSGEPPMRACAQHLLAALGEAGPVLVYGDFERRMLHQLAQRLPDLKQPLRALAERVVDLLPWVQQHYYHRDMHGAWSLKAVVPTLAAGNTLAPADEVSEGLGAQVAYLEAIAATTSLSRRQALAAALKNYCGRDVDGLVAMVRYFADSDQ